MLSRDARRCGRRRGAFAAAFAPAVLGAALPATAPRTRPAIDYVGAALLACGLSAIVLVTSLGGTTWSWGSAQVVLVGAGGVALIFAFLLAERRAREPVLSLSLLRDRVLQAPSTRSVYSRHDASCCAKRSRTTAPTANPEVIALLHRLARELCGEPPVGREAPAAVLAA